MNLDTIREERAKWLTWKNIVPMREALANIQNIDTENLQITYDDWFTVGDKTSISNEDLEMLHKNAKALIPWRKGPFSLCGLKIDSEWQSKEKRSIFFVWTQDR